MTLSPRLGVVYHPTRTQALRFTYNRAFSSPDAASLFLDVRSGSLDPFDYDVRASSVPKDGFTFGRDCDGGLCMETPWAGVPSSIPADATLTWDVLVSLLPDSLGLSQIDAPNSSQVGTDLRSLRPDGDGFDANTVLDMNLGYRLIKVPRMVLAVDATNVFDKQHQEYVGGAEIGRLIMVRLQMEL